MTRETFLFLLSIGTLAAWVFVYASTEEDPPDSFYSFMASWLVLNFVFFVVASCQLAASLPSGGAR